MENFTPFISLVGGVFIGVATVVLMLGMGRIMGASGIVAGVINVKNINLADKFWRLFFIGGMIVGALLYAKFTHMNISETIHINSSNLTLIMAGICVGVGTILAGGCTSGHGVSGLSRLSIRSLVAVPVFMSVATITSTIIDYF